MKNYVYFFASKPLKYLLSLLFKGKFDEDIRKAYKFAKESFYTAGYHVSIENINKAMVKKYIK